MDSYLRNISVSRLQQDFQWNNLYWKTYSSISSLIPNVKPLPKGIEICFAWNKGKRENKSKDEQYIEGIGVISDYIYKPTSYDILNDGESIFNRIMDDMGNSKNRKKFYLNR